MKTYNILEVTLGIVVGLAIGMHYNYLYKELEFNKKAFNNLVYQAELVKLLVCKADEESVYFKRDGFSYKGKKDPVFTSELPSSIATYGVGCRDKTTKIIRQEGYLINFMTNNNEK